MLKKTILFILVGLILTVIWINLPVKYNRCHDIKVGNELVQKIEKFRVDSNKLPDYADWATLKSIGFSDESLQNANPEYQRINDSVYELVFVLGFDGPYLLWNSKEQIWKEDFPTIQEYRN